VDRALSVSFGLGARSDAMDTASGTAVTGAVT